MNSTQLCGHTVVLTTCGQATVRGAKARQHPRPVNTSDIGCKYIAAYEGAA
jgi:hypothetical protein